MGGSNLGAFAGLASPDKRSGIAARAAVAQQKSVVNSVSALVPPHDLVFGINAACKAADCPRKINRSEVALPQQEAVKATIRTTVTPDDRALIVDPVGIRNAASQPAAGEDARDRAGVIETTETALA